MDKPSNIVIIGGTACGPKAAARARRCDPQARITIVEQGENLSTATCGLPYYVSGAIDNQSALVARGQEFFRNVLNIEVLTHCKALAIDRQAHKVKVLNTETDSSSDIGYDKLILATGSMPVVPDLEGSHLGGIFTFSKIADAIAIRKLVSAHKIKKAAVIGAGLIGLEMAEALVSQGLEVTMVEALDRVLPALLDFEVAACVERHLQHKGVNLLLGRRVTSFEGDGKGWVGRVRIGDTGLESGLVLLAIGTRPNTGLARDAGLTIGSAGGISVNPYLQTSDPDIYAGGDCVENVNRITQDKVLAPMGSTANKHGRVIGTNVTGGREIFPGVMGTAIAKIFDYNVGRVGLSESQAREAGYDVVTSIVQSSEHATYYPGGKEILVKLVAARDNNRLLPLKELRAKLDGLPRDAEIITFCYTSVRAYQAQRILDGAGFKSVVFMDGSMAAWPYTVKCASPASHK